MVDTGYEAHLTVPIFGGGTMEFKMTDTKAANGHTRTLHVRQYIHGRITEG